VTGADIKTDAAPPLKFELRNLAATEELARQLASILRAGDVIALDGDLGAGKTVFARALIRTIGGEEIEVPSPTFTLVQTYDLPIFEIWHFDLYRLETPRDAFELDIEEAFAAGVSLIEWPGKLGDHLPSTRLGISFEFAEESNARRVIITGYDGWGSRLATLRDD
jgi:tRNA threonylcarbamoyladenosine biosynthesis protein TsaE